MDFIEECMESIFTCFNRGKNNETAKGNPHHSLCYLDPLDLLDDGKLEKEFENLVEECGLSEERQADLKMYSREKKLTMLNTQSFRAEEDCGKLIDLLRTFECETPELIAPPVSTLQDIVTTLRTQRSRMTLNGYFPYQALRHSLAEYLTTSLEFRVHLRCEFLLLGMANALSLIRPQASYLLQDHLDLFEMMRKEDEIVLLR
ncbi:unnamed protein product [Angiostrongylus costaricensis]|uniref:Drf_FH3 domain-containing protein n=1 Tax=Angiostrongylus costaricensis TaxID=334426 RepID=A0A0R3PD76_ANGCS|nr:unnamed protein product [Angiostrongylus costaricensis]